VPARSWLYTCAVPVSVQCANAQLLSFGGDLLHEKTTFVRVAGTVARRMAKNAYCTYNRQKNNAWRARGARTWVSVNFRKFSPCMACARRTLAGLTFYSLSSKNHTQGHKSISTDASCDWLQFARKNRGRNIFLRKLLAKIQFPRALFSSLRFISSFNPHTILKNARRGRLKNIFIFIYRSSM
jgi:hypothetical protein